jgi:acyl-CoA hydrolase
MNAKRVAETRVEMAQVVEPNDANFLGKAFGGAVLSMIDLAAYATASKFAGNVCVTASFDRVDFLQPIEVGEFVTLVGHVSFVGRTSVEVTIDVFAEDILRGERRHTNTARVTMVAIKDERPTEVPRLVCETHEEKVAFLEGRLRREMRGVQRAEFEKLAARLRDLAPADLDRLIAAEGLLGAL